MRIFHQNVRGWLDKKKNYGWKYRRTKMKYCMVMGRDFVVWRDNNCAGGNMTSQGTSIRMHGWAERESWIQTRESC